MTDINCLNTKLAIIGFDAQLDGLTCVDRVEAALYEGAVHTSFAHTVAMNPVGFADYATLCKQSATAVVEANKLDASDVAVVIISDSNQTIDGAQDTHFSYFFSCKKVSNLADALQLSEKLINDCNVAVLLIAANLQTDLLKKQAAATISFAEDFSAYGSTNGVCCVLLASQDFALARNSYIYTWIKSAVSSNNIKQEINQVINSAFSKAGVSSDLISSVEVSACAEKQFSDLEENALLSAYQNGKTLNSSISCAKSVLGENGPLSELFGLLNSTFTLQQRYRPAIKEWTSPAPEQLEKWLASPFYLFNQAAPVFPKVDGSPRYAAYSCLSIDRYSHLILQENNDKQIHSNGFNAQSDLSLFIIAGDSQADLLEQLKTLSNNLQSLAFKSLAKTLYSDFAENSQSKYRVVLLAESAAQLQKEINQAVTGITSAFANSSDWKTPKGSYFTANPTQSENNISFLYPGIGATYLGLGRDLLHLFPEIYPSVIALADDISASLKDQLLNPRSVVSLDFKQLKQLDLALRNELANIAECGVGYACVFTKIFAEVFNIKADFAAGYSMGEVSMFAALGCWKNPGQMSARLANSQTFNQQLSGELHTLRKLWNLPSIKVGGEKQIWESYNIKGTVRQVQSAIGDNERVYITIVNTADSLVIAGYPADCMAVIARLGVSAMPLNVPNAIHSAPAYQEYQQMLDLYSMDLAERIPTKLYSSSCYLAVPFNKKAISVSIAKCLCEQVDFPRLINSLVKQGASVFIEMGAGRSLTTWTDKIMKEVNSGTQHICVPVNAKGTDDQLSYARALAKLVSFGIKADLDSFFYGSIIQPVN